MAEERKPKRKLAETQKILVDQGIKTRKQITEELDGALAIHEFCSRALTERPCHPLHRLLPPCSARAVIALHRRGRCMHGSFSARFAVLLCYLR